MCAIVTDPDGLADVLNVYADVFYPENIALGSSHVALSDQSGLGCGKLMQEDSLTKLTKNDGIELFCGSVILAQAIENPGGRKGKTVHNFSIAPHYSYELGGNWV